MDGRNAPMQCITCVRTINNNSFEVLFNQRSKVTGLVFNDLSLSSRLVGSDCQFEDILWRNACDLLLDLIAIPYLCLSPPYA